MLLQTIYNSLKLPQRDGDTHLYCLEKWCSQHALVENPDPQSFLNPLVSLPGTQKQMFSSHSAQISLQIWLRIHIVPDPDSGFLLQKQNQRQKFPFYWSKVQDFKSRPECRTSGRQKKPEALRESSSILQCYGSGPGIQCFFYPRSGIRFRGGK